jgi:hypothetical protein
MIFRAAHNQQRPQAMHRGREAQLTTPYVGVRIRKSVDDRHCSGFSTIRRVGQWPNQKGVQADSGPSVIPSSA